MNFIELFCGSGTLTEEFKSNGHNTFSVDVRRRKGVCMPDLKKDVIDLTPADIPFHPDVIWASPPCDCFSNAAGSLHWNGKMQMTEKSLQHIKVLKKVLVLINQLNPDYFFIENPRGKMRYLKIMTDWLIRNKGMIKELTLSSYGFPSTKPTDIFTNAIDIKFKPMQPFGRGAKSSGKMDNMTKCSKQKTPSMLARFIREYCESKVT